MRVFRKNEKFERSWEKFGQTQRSYNSFFFISGEVYIKIRVFRKTERSLRKTGRSLGKLREVYFKMREV